MGRDEGKHAISTTSGAFRDSTDSANKPRLIRIGRFDLISCQNEGSSVSEQTAEGVDLFGVGAADVAARLS